MRVGKEAKAAIICRSAIMKHAITQSLEADGIECVDSPCKADVGLVIAGMILSYPHDQEDDDIGEVDAPQWVVMARSVDDPAYLNMINRGLDPCIVPEDIDGEDLCHVVRLAVSGHLISMGKFCRESHPKDAKILNDADLDEDQWMLLAHLSQGLSNKEIAIEENTTEGAIKARLRCLLKKLKLNNRTKAAVMAARCGVQAPASRHRIAA